MTTNIHKDTHLIEALRLLQLQEGELARKQVELARLEARLRGGLARVLVREATLRSGLDSARRRELDELNKDKALADAMAVLRAMGNLTGVAVKGVLLACPVD